MLTELKAIFENVDEELLNKDTLDALSTLVEQTVDQKVNDRLVLETETKLQEMDEDHAKHFKAMLEKIDQDHTGKVKMVVEALNKDHINKLKIIKKKYDEQLTKVAVEHRQQLVESMNDFLEVYIDKTIPAEQILEAAKNKHLSKIVSEAKTVLGIDERYVTQNVKAAIKDGKAQMDKLAKENFELKQSKLVEESRRLIAEKTANLPADLAKFVRARFVRKTPEFIKENFKYVVELYDRKEKNEKRSMLNENKSFNVDRNRVADEIITETSKNTVSNTSQSDNPTMDMYIGAMEYRK